MMRRILPAILACAVCGCASHEPMPVTFPRAVRSAGALEGSSDSSREPVVEKEIEPGNEQSPPAPPRPRIGGDERFAFEFRDTPVRDAFRLIAEKAGVNFVIPVDIEGTVSASLPSVTLDQALDVALREADAELVERDGVFLVRRIERPDWVRTTFRPRSADIKVLEQQIARIVGDGGGAYTVNPEANVVYVAAPPERVAEIEALLEAMDQAPREVLIEARILEISLDEDFEFGMATSFGDISIGETTSAVLSDFLRPSEDFRIATLGDKTDVEVVLQALQSYGRLHVIANPRVLAVNHQEAKIEIIERVPYIEATATTTTTADGAGATTVQQVEFEEVGIRLHVTPVLGDGDEITLKILQEVSEVVDFFQTVPVTDSRKVDTRFVVGDRQTIAIGGLLKERTKKNRSGVPLLMDIPLLGRFFSGEDVVREKVELLVFITPRIVERGEVEGISSEFKREIRLKSAEYGVPYREYLDDVRD